MPIQQMFLGLGALDKFELWYWGGGQNAMGQSGQNDNVKYSSPVQIGSDTNWSTIGTGQNNVTVLASKSNGTLWAWGDNQRGQLGQNSRTYYSSPVQIPGTTWAGGSGSKDVSFGVKTDGTLWAWGGVNDYGNTGLNSLVSYSSPVQIPGTTWDASKIRGGYYTVGAIKTDGTLWAWGSNSYGRLGQNNFTQYSSPVQIPGTTWTQAIVDSMSIATKSDGTLWVWGNNRFGSLGQNEHGNTAPEYNATSRSSPVQIPGTDWVSSVENGSSIGRTSYVLAAIRTNGTLWVWGRAGDGEGGWNSTSIMYSSPVQLPGTTWRSIEGSGGACFYAQKTDGTMWTWGHNEQGQLGQNNQIQYSSPVQIPGTDWNHIHRGGDKFGLALKKM